MAARTIRQRISLDGAEEIKSALQQIGDAGRAAFQAIEKELKQAGDAGAPLVRRLDQLRANVREFQAQTAKVALSTRKFKLALSDLASASGTVITRFGLLTAAVTGAGVAFGAFANSAAQSIDEVGKTAEELGLTVEQFQRLEFAAGQSGRAGDVFQQAFSKISVAIGEAERSAAEGVAALQQIGQQARQTGETINGVTVFRPGGATQQGLEAVKEKATGALAAMKELGVSLLNADQTGRNAYDVFLDTAEALRNVGNATTRARLGNALFGEEYRKLLPLLKDGRLGIEQLGDEAVRLGIVLSREDTDIAAKFSDQVDTLGKVVESFRNRVFVAVGPALTAAVTSLTQFLAENREKVQAYATGILEDFTSIIGDIPALLRFEDIDVDNKWLIDLRDGLIALKDGAVFAVDVIRTAFNTLSTALEPVAGLINSLFGTNLSGPALLVTAVILKLTGAFKLLGAAWAVLKTGKGVVTSVFGLFRSGLPVIRDLAFFLGKGLVGAFRGLLPAVRALGGPLGLVVRALGFLSGALLGIIGLPGLIAVGLAAAAAAVYVYWDDIVAAADEAWQSLKDTFGEIVAGVAKFTSDAWEGLKARTAEAWDATTKTVSDGWDQIQRDTSAAGVRIATAATTLWGGTLAATEDARTALATKAGEIWEEVRSRTAGAYATLKAAAKTTWSSITEAAGEIRTELSPIWESIRDTARSTLSTIATTVLEAWSGATATIEDSANAIRDAISRATEIAGDIEGAEQLAAQLVAPFIDARDQIQRIVDGFGALAENGFRGVLQAVDNIADDIARRIDRIISDLRRAAEEARRLARAASDGGDGGSTTGSYRTVVQQFASGGSVRGAGTGTSDSILSWLSNGEYVLNAKAVRFWGVPVLEAMNRISGSVAGLKGSFAGFPKFATGGLADASRIQMPSFDGILSGVNAAMASMSLAPSFAAPAFASAASGRPLVLDLGGGKRINAGTVTPDVVGELLRHAKQSSAAQIGRKPGWAGS